VSSAFAFALVTYREKSQDIQDSLSPVESRFTGTASPIGSRWPGWPFRLNGRSSLKSTSLVFKPKESFPGDIILISGLPAQPAWYCKQSSWLWARRIGRLNLQITGDSMYRTVLLSLPGDALMLFMDRLGFDADLLIDAGFYPQGGGKIQATIRLPRNLYPTADRTGSFMPDPWGICNSKPGS
jgi:hypothetical protein